MKRRTFLHTLPGSLASAFLLYHPTQGMASSLLQPFAAEDKDLSAHTLSALQFSEVQMQWPRQVGKNAQLDVHGHGPKERICIITTNQGAKGWGMTRGNQQSLEAAETYAKGKKLTEVFDVAVGVKNEQALPLDVALHDLAGVILDKPVYELLGKNQPYITDCYSGMIYFDDLEPADNPAGLDKILEECQYDYDYGYRQFKLKIGRGNKWMPKQEGLQRDIEVTKLVAENFPDCDILVDANNGYTVDDTIAYIKGIEGIKLFWIEEPFHETEEDYKKLKAWLKSNHIETLLADGEAKPDFPLLRKLEAQKIIDVHLPDIIGYGFTPWRKLMPELIQMGTPASPHAWGSQLKTYYIAHLAGGLGNTITIEGVTCQSDDVDFGDYQLKEGKLIPSSEPGFGMKLLKSL